MQGTEGIKGLVEFRALDIHASSGSVAPSETFRVLFLCVPLREARLGRHPRVAAPVNKRGAKENTACRQTCEAAYCATGRAQVERITRKWSVDKGQQTDR